MTNTFRIILIISLFCFSIFIQSCGSKDDKDSSRSQKQSTTMVVKGVVIKPQPLDNIVRSSGTVLASESVDLTAESAGRIETILFQEGRHVKRNDLLVKINDDDLQAQLKKTSLQIQLSTEQAERQKQLYDKNLISKEQYDISLNQLNSQKADYENLIAAIRKKEIRSPFDGIIGLRYVSEGGYVSQTTRIASIQKINPLKVDFAIPEKYSGQVSVGDLVRFRNDEAKLEFTGKLYAIEPKIDADTRTLQLRALCDNKAEKVLPGAYVQIELQLKEITDALLVPTQAIIPVLKGQTLLIRKNGVAVSIPVKTGIRTATSIQIIDGIAPGDTVITTGIMQLRTGMPITVLVK
jgi:membrane fusion protein, multidrug efflux system